MSKWNKKWDNDKPERKIHKKRQENPKHILVFKDVFDSSENNTTLTTPNEDANIQQHMFYTSEKDPTIMEGLENQSDNDNSPSPSIVSDVKDKVDNIGDRLSNATKVDPIAKLNAELSSSLNGLSNLQNFGSELSSMGDGLNSLTSTSAPTSFNINSEGIKKTTTSITDSARSLSAVITNVFTILGQKIQILKIYIQLFILRSNRYIRETITKLAQAITQNTATDQEIDTFQDQTQKFITILLVWYFVYNWYYIIFFLEDEDKVRYTFNVDKIQHYNKYLYGAIGPGFRVIEWFNWAILSFSNLKKYLPNALLMFGMFIVFYTLVEMNFQTSLLQDFFNTMRGKFSVSVLSIIVTVIVVIHSVSFFFGSEANGGIHMTNMVSKQQTIASVCFFLVLFVLAVIGYSMWTVAVNIPLGMLSITTYLVIYSFFGVMFYEGFNFMNIITGITDSIDTIVPDLTAEACKPDAPMFSVDWIKHKFVQLWDFISGIINFSTINMFEILIILNLLGGIGIYKSQWASSVEGKIGMDLSSPTSVASTFKRLFFWLIIINVLIIIIMGIFLYRKYKLISELSTGADGVSDMGKMDETMRSRMQSASNPNAEKRMRDRQDTNNPLNQQRQMNQEYMSQQSQEDKGQKQTDGEQTPEQKDGEEGQSEAQEQTQTQTSGKEIPNIQNKKQEAPGQPEEQTPGQEIPNIQNEKQEAQEAQEPEEQTSGQEIPIVQNGENDI